MKSLQRKQSRSRLKSKESLAAAAIHHLRRLFYAHEGVRKIAAWRQHALGAGG